MLFRGGASTAPGNCGAMGVLLSPPPFPPSPPDESCDLHKQQIAITYAVGHFM